MESINFAKTGNAGETWRRHGPSQNYVTQTRGQNTHQVPIWFGGLATAEVGQCPSRILLHAELVVLAQKRQKRRQGTLSEDVISANRAAISDVPQSPNCLFTDIKNKGREQPNEPWDSVGVNNHLGVVSRSSRNVR